MGQETTAMTDYEIEQIEKLSIDHCDSICNLIVDFVNSRQEESRPLAFMEFLALAARLSTAQAVSLVLQVYTSDPKPEMAMNLTNSALSRINASVRNHLDPTLRN